MTHLSRAKPLIKTRKGDKSWNSTLSTFANVLNADGNCIIDFTLIISSQSTLSDLNQWNFLMIYVIDFNFLRLYPIKTFSSSYLTPTKRFKRLISSSKLSRRTGSISIQNNPKTYSKNQKPGKWIFIKNTCDFVSFYRKKRKWIKMLCF